MRPFLFVFFNSHGGFFREFRYFARVRSTPRRIFAAILAFVALATNDHILRRPISARLLSEARQTRSHGSIGVRSENGGHQRLTRHFFIITMRRN
ncbi:hypothetical protein BURPS668_0372 [Burkholderia pseudomallei 668]|nr:hypothetical protein BURPS668_0372 [Burkholderia pseudomallei 668]